MKANGSTTAIKTFLCFLVLCFGLPLTAAVAEDICARVKIEIVQELTFERVAFDAKMKITNGLPLDLENIRVDVFIQDINDADRTELFFMRLSDMDNIAAVDGSGIVQANKTAEIHWLIIPSPGAGGEAAEGIEYFAGATLSYTAGGNSETMSVEPDKITVRPQPLLVLDYFLPRYVYGDDPYTSETEPPVPYDLGVRVDNVGFGKAANLKIDSGQPKIVDNEQGLLIDFRIISSTVNGAPSPETLLVEFGDISPKTAGMARWQMISTLTGRFVTFDAAFTHADELGGELTSLIDSVYANVWVHNVLVDRYDRDDRLDFLGEEEGSHALKVWESDSLKNDVADVSGESSLTRAGSTAYELKTPIADPFVYVKLTAPTQGKVPIQSVYRSDGKSLKNANYWIQKERRSGSKDDIYFCLFDTDTTGTYIVTYDFDAIDDTTAPVSTLLVQEPSQGADPYYVNAFTEMLFLAEDPETGVRDMKFNIDAGTDGPWEAVINPFRFELRPALTEGEHTLWYYAENTVGLQEIPRATAVYLDRSAPSDLAVSADPVVFTPGAPAEAAVDRSTLITYGFDDDVRPQARAVMDIAVGTATNFDDLPQVRSFERLVAPGASSTLVWDGTDSGGGLLGPGTYSIRLTADDGLGHITLGPVATVEILPYLDEGSLAAGSGDQMYPDVYEQTVVWQDNRDGNWEIYQKEGQTVENLTHDDAGQERPAVSADFVVWQDFRSGDWDIYYYNRSDASTRSLTLPGDQTDPDIDGSQLVYQGNHEGSWEIYTCNLAEATPVPVRISDGNERDQIRPRISGNRVVWEDYRFGKPEIYLCDGLPSGDTVRVTFAEDTYQTHPVIAGGIVLWVDSRYEQNDIFTYNIDTGQSRRLTYGTADQVQPAIQNGRMAFVELTDADDPNLIWGNAATGTSDPLVIDPARQEAPALYGNRLVWQDDRLGRWQIYQVSVTRPELTITFSPGLNLICAPSVIVADAATDTAFELLAAWNAAGHTVSRLLQYDADPGLYQEAVWNDTDGEAQGSDFTLKPQQALVVYAGQESRLDIDTLTPETAMPLPIGLNALGWAALPSGYTAADMIRSIGLENVRSLRFFERETGRFQTLSVEEIPLGAETDYVLRGRNFAIPKGSGCLVVITKLVLSWRP